MEGELNIQNSASGTFIPEIFGGDVAEFFGSDDDGDVTIDPDGGVVVKPSGGTPVVIGQAFAWFEAADIDLSNLSDINCTYSVTFLAGNEANANLTRYWPGKGRYFRKLSGDIEKGSRYFLSPEIIEPSPADYPQLKANLINGRAAVAFSGNETYCAQRAPYDPGGSLGEDPHAFSSSSRLTIFLLARHAPHTSSTGTFFTLSSAGVYNISFGERARISLVYFGDLDAFGFSMNDQVGDVYGVGNASNWVNDWFLVTAIVSPNGDGVARRIRVNGVEQSVSQIRNGTGATASAPFALTGAAVLILGAASTVQQSSLDAFFAANPSSTEYSAQKSLHGDIGECLVVHTTSEISAPNLAAAETILMRKYGLIS